MDLLEGILTRRSIRKYQDKAIDQETLREIINAAQHAPSAHNKQPWEFLVINDKEVMAGLRSVQRWTSFAKDAACVVFVCGAVDNAFSRLKDGESWNFADVDCALATQNLMLAAHAKGVGTCFCGAAPMTRVVEDVKKMFALPDNIRPLAIITMGYPDETPKQPDNRFSEAKIHWGKW